MLQLKNAALESAAGKRSVHALRCLNLVLPETGFVVLTGASGSGKTALLHLLAMTEEPSRGEILVYGENTARWNEKRRAAWRREIAAADEALLFEDLTLGENAERAAVLAGFSRRDSRENAREALALFGLEGAAEVYPDRLSGEERRLGALACALARKSRVLLVDEPADGMSAESGETVRSALREAAKEQLVVAAARNADAFGEDVRVITLEDGQIVSDSDETGEKTAVRHESVAGASGAERLRMAFSNLKKKKSRVLPRLLAPFCAVLLVSLLFAAFAGGEQSAKNAETAMLSAYPVTLDRESVPSGDLNALGDWLDGHTDETTVSVQRRYAITPRIYSGDAAAGIEALNREENGTLWTQLPEGETLRQLRYTLVSGRWPERYDEAAVLLDERGRVDESCLKALGLDSTANANIGYTELLRLSFRVLLPSDEYVQNVDGTWGYMGGDEAYLSAKIAASQRLNIVGILRPAGEAPGESSTGGAAYLPELMNWTVETVLGSALVQAQTASPDTDILTGLPFDTEGVYAQDEAGRRAALRGYAVGQTPAQQASIAAELTSAAVETERAKDVLLQTIAALSGDALENAFARYIASGVSSGSLEGNLRAFGAEAAQTVTQLRLYAANFPARETLGAVLRGYTETVTYSDPAAGIVQPGLTLLNSAADTDRLGAILAAILAGAAVVLVSALAASARKKELLRFRALGLAAPQGVIGAESLLLGLFGGVLGAGAAYAVCALLGALGGAALVLSWQTAAASALGAALLSWASGVLAASGTMKK